MEANTTSKTTREEMEEWIHQPFNAAELKYIHQVLPVREKDLDLYDGAILYYLQGNRIFELNRIHQTLVAKAAMLRTKEIMDEWGVSEEEAYWIFVERGDIAEGFGNWLLARRAKGQL